MHIISISDGLYSVNIGQVCKTFVLYRKLINKGMEVQNGLFLLNQPSLHGKNFGLDKIKLSDQYITIKGVRIGVIYQQWVKIQV